MRNIFKISAIVSILLIPQLSQAQATSPMEVSATVEAGCFISANNLNFGTLTTPITTQQTQNTIDILCSNNTPLNLGVSYSGNVISSGGSQYTYQFQTKNSNSNWYSFHKDGVLLQDSANGKYTIGCAHSYERFPNNNIGVANAGKVYFYSQEALDFYKITNASINFFHVDIWGICSNNTLNVETFNKYSNGETKGVMNGISKGEQIKFEIKNPQKSNSYWGSSSSSTYSFNGTGVNQTLNMIAEINSSYNPTYRMTPDSYNGTINLILTY